MVKLIDYMEIQNSDSFPQPPASIQILGQGFNIAANNVAIILLPIFLDVFLWLGPRIKITNLMQPILADIHQLETSGQAMPMPTETLLEFWNGFNLLTILRTFPLGVPSLMAINISNESPLGLRADFEADTWLMVLAATIGLMVLGWVLGALYYRQVSQVTLNYQNSLTQNLIQSVLLSGTWHFVAFIASLPVLLILGILLLINGLLANIAYLILLVIVLWLAIPAFFSAHGIFSKGNNAFQSIVQSFRLARYGLPPLGWFILLAVVISQGMDALWRIPPANSWMALVGIFGHAFISSSLLAASFIYYYEMHNWIERAAQWLNSQAASNA